MPIPFLLSNAANAAAHSADKKRTFLHRRLTTITTALVVVVWGTYLAGMVLGGGRLNAFTNTPFGEDLLSLHAAGQIVVTQPAALYVDDVGKRVQAETLGPVGREVFNRYLSPPHTAFLLSPLGRLPFSWALALWSALSLAALAAVPFLLGNARPWRDFALALLFAPVVDGFASGQNALFTLTLFALGFRWWTRGRGFAAGLAIAGVALYKPHLLAGPALLFLLDAGRDRRPLLGLLTGVLGFAAIDLLGFPNETRAFLSWGESVIAGRAPIWSQLRPGGEFTVGAGFQLLLPGAPGLARWLGWAAQVAGVIAFVVWHRRMRPRREGPPQRWTERTLFAGATLVTLWLTPHAHLYEWTLLLLPGFLLWRNQAAHDRLLPLVLVFFAVTPLCVRLARWQLAALGVALHPAVLLLLIAAEAIALVVRLRDRAPAWWVQRREA